MTFFQRDNVTMKPSDFKPHHMGDGRRFHVREYNGGKFQVYGLGLEHLCDCDRPEVAQMIADTLEKAALETPQSKCEP